MPARYKLVENEPWKSEGIRYLIVKNFNIYYWIEESKGFVHITAVVYGRRDQYVNYLKWICCKWMAQLN